MQNPQQRSSLPAPWLLRMRPTYGMYIVHSSQSGAGHRLHIADAIFWQAMSDAIVSNINSSRWSTSSILPVVACRWSSVTKPMLERFINETIKCLQVICCNNLFFSDDLVTAQTVITAGDHMYTVSQKVHPFYFFCDYSVKCWPIPIIFGTSIAAEKICNHVFLSYNIQFV